jgi:L-asparaginase type II
MTTERMWALRARLLHHLARPEVDGIVVTHGTDSLEESAYLMGRSVPTAKPVVFTGAMRTSSDLGWDGPGNLGAAVRVAAADSAQGQGVMVAMMDRIYSALDVTKIHTTRPDAFDAPTRGPLGDVTRRVEFYHPAPRTNCSQPEFVLTPTTTFPRVDIVYAYLGADSVGVQALVDAGARGIVVAGAGAGATTPAQGAALRRAREKGVAIVTASRTGSGSVGTGGGRGQGQQAPQLSAGDLTPQKARIRLMLALTQSSDPAEVVRLFTER